MSRAIFKGSMSIGLVTIPVKVYPATRDKTISFNVVHSKCYTRLKYKRWCPRCEAEVDWNEVDKGYAISKDKMVVITDEELERLQPKTTKTIDVRSFVDLASIDPIYFNAHYYIAPDEGGERAYSLLRDVLALTGRAALGKVVIHNKEHAVLVRPYQKGLLMTTLHYSDEIVDIGTIGELGGLAAPGEQELSLAKVLIEHMAGDFKPEEYVNGYRQAVMRLIRQKAEGVILPEPEPVEAKPTVDLMKALEESVKAAKRERPPIIA